ncbi:hypothetical protein BKA62DRAFT_812488 [Auriculariales sp. MPI-PUGE-AT-0066]|nr:hypothetical protein BKA62DRAFT_812488 [Auriculariales sp. MPI-PUGE-AT-0066]
MSGLLIHSTLQPHGRDGLCAVRFSAAVRVQKLRINRAEPDAVVLDIYLNCQPVPSAVEPKPKATNALVPSRIVHTGGARDYLVNMSLEYSTKLMVIKGDFTSADVSVYGSICTPGPVDTAPAATRERPVAQLKHQLPASLDPAYSSADPLQLGRALLGMMSDPPALPLVVKFALCHDLHDELAAQSGAQLYTDLAECLDSLDIGLDWVRTAMETTRRPVTEQVAEDTLRQFAERVQDSLYDKNEDQPLVLSQLLFNTACQSHSVAHVFLSMWDPHVWGGLLLAAKDNGTALKPVLKHLSGAAACRDVATFLRRAIYESLDELAYETPHLSHGVRRLARRLISRLRGWDSLGALTAPRNGAAGSPAQTNGKDTSSGKDEESMDFDREDSSADFLNTWLYAMLNDETTLGVLLLSILSSHDLSESLLSLPDIELPTADLGQDMGQWQSVGHLFRAIIGVGGVLAALAWSDAADEPEASLRVLGILRLWQARSHDYGQLVNTMLVIPRLFNMIDAQLVSAAEPTKTQYDAERLMFAIMNDPRSACARHVWTRFSDPDAENPSTLLSAVASPANELGSSRFSHGWSTAVSSDSGVDQVTRFALEIVQEQLAELGVVELRTASWNVDVHGVDYVIADVLTAHARTLVDAGSFVGTGRGESLLANAAVALTVMKALLPSTPEPMPTAVTRSLVQSIISLVASARGLQLQSQTCGFSATALIDRAVSLIQALSLPAAKVALRTLADYSIGQPKLDLTQKMNAIAEVLNALLTADVATGSQAARWAAEVAVSSLSELQMVIGVMTPKRKADVILKLANVDKDDFGVADWIIQEELVQLERSAAALRDTDEDASNAPNILLRAYVSQTFEWIALVAEEQAHDTNGALLQAPKITWAEASLARALIALVDADHISLDTEGPIMLTARTLRPHDPLLGFAIAVVLVGDTQPGSLPRAAELLQNMPSDSEPDPPQLAKLSLRLGLTFRRLAKDDSVVDPAVADLLCWLLDHHNDFEPFVLHGVSEADFMIVASRVADKSARIALEGLRPRCAAQKLMLTRRQQ